MKYNLYKKVIDELIEIGGKTVWLTPVMGEALIDPNIFEKIKYAKKKKLIVKLYSNGVLLNRKNNYKKNLNSGLDKLFISLGGY